MVSLNIGLGGGSGGGSGSRSGCGSGRDLEGLELVVLSKEGSVLVRLLEPSSCAVVSSYSLIKLVWTSFRYLSQIK